MRSCIICPGRLVGIQVETVNAKSKDGLEAEKLKDTKQKSLKAFIEKFN